MPPTNLFGLGYGVGPAGYGYPSVGRWSPLSLGTSLAAWYQADAGCYTDAACLFASASSQYLSRAGSAILRGGATWWRAGWVKLTTTGAQGFLLDTLGTNQGIRLVVTSGDVVSMTCGTGSGTVVVSHATVLSGSTWYFVYAQYDGSKIGLSLNAGALAEQNMAAFDAGTSTFDVGGEAGFGYLDGAMARWCGGDGTLSGEQITALYAGGAGLFYADLPADIAALTGFAFNLCESSGGRVDSVGALNLTPTNGPTVAAGPGEGACVDNSPCKRRNDQSGLGRDQTWATTATQPVWKANIKNGRPALLYVNGTTRALAATFTQAQPLAVFVAAKHSSGTVGSNQIIVYGQAGAPAIYLRAYGSEWGYYAGVEGGGGSTDGSWHVHAATFDGASSTRRVDGTQVDASDVGAGGYTTYASGDQPAGGQAWDGYSAEEFLMAGTPTSAQLASAEAYLTQRWT